MKNWKSLYFLLITFLALTLFTTGCKEDRVAEENEAYIVNVEIISPNNNTTMAVGTSFNVEVDYKRTENIIHNIKVEILDKSGNIFNKLVERHAHVPNEFIFKSENISIDQVGIYVIRASTTDLLDGDSGEHTDGEGQDNDNLVEHTFTIQ